MAEEAVTLYRQIGQRRPTASALSVVAVAAGRQGDFAAARGDDATAVVGLYTAASRTDQAPRDDGAAEERHRDSAFRELAQAKGPRRRDRELRAQRVSLCIRRGAIRDQILRRADRSDTSTVPQEKELYEVAAQRRAGLFSEYPFGTDLTREEIELARALRWLKDHTGTRWQRWRMMARSFTTRVDPRDQPYLERLGLGTPRDMRESITADLVVLALNATRQPAAASQTGATDP